MKTRHSLLIGAAIVGVALPMWALGASKKGDLAPPSKPDGCISSGDVLQIARLAAAWNGVVPTADQIAVGDVAPSKLDGKLTNGDVLLIAKVSVGWPGLSIGTPSCQYLATCKAQLGALYEVDEVTYDGVDNDCDGATDESLCLIDGQSYVEGEPSPTDPCLLCAPAASETAWSAAPDLSPCVADTSPCTDDFCQAGQCVAEPNGLCTQGLATVTISIPATPSPVAGLDLDLAFPAAAVLGAPVVTLLEPLSSSEGLALFSVDSSGTVLISAAPSTPFSGPVDVVQVEFAIDTSGGIPSANSFVLTKALVVGQELTVLPVQPVVNVVFE